jgi:hypothetical protein
MKAIYLLINSTIAILFFCNNLLCQDTFKLTMKDPLTNEVIHDAIELSNGSFILACNEWAPSASVHLVRLSKTGKELASKVFTYNGLSCGLTSVAQINQNQFIFGGYVIVDTIVKVWVYETDSLLNELNSKTFKLDTNNMYSINIKISKSGNILCSGLAVSPLQYDYAYLYELSPGLDSIRYKLFNQYSAEQYPSLLEKKYGEGYYFFLTGYHPTISNFSISILDLDQSFSINHINGVPLRLSNFSNSLWINNKDYVTTGLKVYSGENDYCIGVINLDTNNVMNHDTIIGDHDTIEYPAMQRLVDLVNPNSIYLGSTHNLRWNEYDTGPSWFGLTNMDSLLNVRWQKFYGEGTVNFLLMGILATHDGGCLMFGTVYDTATQYNELDVQIIKVNSDGLVGGINNNGIIVAHDANVFPNPGTDYIIIQSSPQIRGAQFRMVTIDGKQVISKSLNERIIKIDTQLLSSGTYPWEIIFQGRKIENGKWVKE